MLFTSGTTGIPKGVQRDTGGYAVALRWTMPAVYGLEPGDVMFCASDTSATFWRSVIEGLSV